MVKKLPANIKINLQEIQVRSLGGEDPLEKEMATIPVFLPGKSHGPRTLEGYSPWDRKRAQQDLATKQQFRRVETHHLQEEWFSYKN